MGIKEFREKVNLKIYDSKSQVLKWLNLISLLVSLSSLGIICYFYGFQHTQAEIDRLFLFVQGSFAFYIIRYFMRVFYEFHPLTFIRKHWFEGTLILLLIIDALSYNLTGKLVIQQFFFNLGLENFAGISNLFLQVYIFIMVGVELKSEYSFLPKFKANPANIFLMTFVILILIGTVLLMLPEMTVQEGSMPAIDALFTATSATCVTGLIVVDTATYFTFKGHLIILILMKLGGLNIISFGAFTAFFAKFGVGIKQHSVMEDFMFEDNIFSSKSLLGKIIFGSLTFEAIGTLLIFWLTMDKFEGNDMGDNLFFSIFHSISAFNNAGFSTLTDGMYNELVRNFFLLHVVLAALIFFGALGFVTFFDLFSISKLRERLKYQWKRPKLGTLLNVYTTLILLLVGAIFFTIFETKENMPGYSFIDSIITSLFQSITLRTAGFSTVDFGSLSVPFLTISIVLMFIGGSSSSTAGGIKTSTFSLMALSAYSTLKGKRYIEIFNRRISQDILFRAFSIFFFSLSSILIGTFILTISETHILEMENKSFLDLLFEEVSAFSTVGLTTGITPLMSTTGKLTLMASMFVGRVGTLTIGYALSRTIQSRNYKYPEEHLLVG